MKTYVRRMLLVVLSLAFFISIAQGLYAEQTSLTILHVNDTHSHLDAFGPKDRSLDGTLGGLAKVAAVIDYVRSENENVILLHAGDLFTGDIFFNKYLGIPELQLMRQLGFDAMAVGNHEFDLTPVGLYSVLSTAFGDGQGSFPLLSANLDLSGFPLLGSFIQSSTIVERSGVRIGIFGLIVPDNPMTLSDPVIISNQVGAIAYGTAAGLRAKGADVVICLSHLGILYDREIAAGVPGIDVIVGGHDHFKFKEPLVVTNPEGKQTLITQAGAFYKYVGKLSLSVDKDPRGVTVAMENYRLMPVTTSVPPVPEIQGTIDILKDGIVEDERYGDVFQTPIGFSLFDLDETSDSQCPLRDTALGNLVTDAFRRKARTDIAITANGLIAEKIYAGCIVPADVFRAVPYGFDQTSGLGYRLVKLRLTGRSILTGLESTLAFVHLTDDFLLQTSGMSYRYDSSRPPGQRVIRMSVRVRGRPIELDASYTVAVNQAIAFLLPGMGVTPESVEPMPEFEYTVVRDYISNLGLVCYQPRGRIIDSGLRK